MHSELDSFYKMAKQLIIENRPFFDEIVRQLMDNKTIASEDIKNAYLDDLIGKELAAISASLSGSVEKNSVYNDIIHADIDFE